MQPFDSRMYCSPINHGLKEKRSTIDGNDQSKDKELIKTELIKDRADKNRTDKRRKYFALFYKIYQQLTHSGTEIEILFISGNKRATRAHIPAQKIRALPHLKSVWIPCMHLIIRSIRPHMGEWIYLQSPLCTKFERTAYMPAVCAHFAVVPLSPKRCQVKRIT